MTVRLGMQQQMSAYDDPESSMEYCTEVLGVYVVSPIIK